MSNEDCATDESRCNGSEDIRYVPPPQKNKKNILETMKMRFKENPYATLLQQHEEKVDLKEEKKKKSRKKKDEEEEEEMDHGAVLTHFMFFVPNLFRHGQKRELGRDPRLSADSFEGGRASLLVHFGDYIQEVRERVDILRNFSKYAEEAVDFICLMVHTEPIIQQGPTCGIVALAMAADVTRQIGASSSATPTVEQILEHAQGRGFSALGELYSCRNMKQLADEFISRAGFEVEHVVDWEPQDLTMHLLKGGLALVPYDSDHHWDPDKRNGRKAHWALLLGCLSVVPKSVVGSNLFQNSSLLWKDKELRDVVCRSNTKYDVFTPYGCHHKVPLASLYHVSQNQLDSDQRKLCQEELVDFYVIARQGKHHFLGFWKIDRLHESNGQLFNSCGKRRSEHFVLNDGSVEAGLARQILLLHPKDIL